MPEIDDFLANDYARVVRSVALACGSVDAAEDAVQVALVEALDYKRRGRQIDNLAAWLFVVATNSNRRRFRRARIEQMSLNRLASLRTEHVAPMDERVIELWPAVLELPRRQRQAVVLFYIHDLDIQTIAALLDVSDGTIKSALHRGRAALGARLGARSYPAATIDKEDDHVR